jgi:4-hydroxyproline epimerase
LFAKGKLRVGDEFIHESFIGSKFVGCVEKETTLNGQKAIIPSVKGWAKIYGQNTITIDTEDDPYALGFQVI